MVRRGELYWIDFGEPVGSEPGYDRPVVIVQDNDFNRTEIKTVVIAVLTTSLRLGKMDGNVLLMPGKNGLKKPSVINVSQIYTVNKTELGDRIGSLAQEDVRRLNNGLKLVLSL